jgi:protein arginine kinase activator
MLCQKCHKNLATARYAEVVDGKVTEQHLCAECLADHQQGGKAGFELSGPVSSSRSSMASAASLETGRRRGRRLCRSCGTSLTKLVETAECGCGVCFSSFAEELEPILTDAHGSSHHVGKTPRVTDVRSRMNSGLQTKRNLLRSALQTESYEEAAMLRDEIRELEAALASTVEKNN